MAEEQLEGVEKWLRIIAAYEKEFAPWEKRVKRLLEKYTDAKAQQRKTAKFNVLWSNVQTLVPAVFSRLPKPDVSRRFKDNDPVGRVASVILERALEYEVEHYPDYRTSLRDVVYDRFLGGRGIAWVRYEPHTKMVSVPDDGLQITEDQDEPPTQEVLDYECCPVDYVHWRDFGHQVARTWAEVDCVWRKVYLGREALVERFGEELGNKIPLDTKPEELRKSIGVNDGEYQAVTYEIWDKPSGKAIWISKSQPTPLDTRDDPLGLEGFWPCPKPLFATLTTDSLIPTPDFTLYQDQAEELDILSDRIDGLIKALQVKGVHDAAIPELKRLFTEGGNNDLIPVKNWAQFSEKAGLKGAIDLVDLTPIFNALLAAYQAFDQVKQHVFEITGISDIVRGATDANETLGAQQLKGQYVNLRLRDMQNAVSEFACDLIRIKAQIICSKFDPQTIMMIGAVDQLSEADKPFVDSAIALLKSGPLRTFRIDVEADSLVMMDENLEKEQRVAFLGAVSGFLKEAIQAPPSLAPLLGQLLKYGVTGFKVGKTVEGDIDQFLEQAKQQAANPPPPPPDPEMVKVQGQMQLQAAKDQSAAQMKQLELQYNDQASERDAQREMQLEQWKQSMQAQQVQHQNELEAQRNALDTQHAAQLKQLELQHNEILARMQDDFSRWKTLQDNETKVVVANIAAAASVSKASAADAESAPEDATEPAEEKPDSNAAVAAAMQALADAFSRPKTIIRGPDGKAIGIQ